MKRTKRRKLKTRKQRRVEKNPKRTYKDELFRMIFGRENERSARWRLDLYNALSGKHHTNPADLKITTLENAIYIEMKNDVSFLVDSQMTLIEHQSSYNPNMPLRGLIYFAKLYQIYVSNKDQDLYGQTLIKIPAPKYVVFYNGNKQLEETSYLKLSDAFTNFEEQGLFEWTATVKNINADYNIPLQNHCKALNDYVKYVDRIKTNLKNNLSTSEAVEEALDWAISKNLLEGFFREQRAEVLAVSITEFDKELYDRCRRREGYNEGVEHGLEQGIEQGAYQKAIENAVTLIKKYKANPEDAAKDMGAPLDKVLEVLKQKETVCV